MERGFCTEAEAKTAILAVAKQHSDNPIVVASKRISSSSTVNRDVTFVIRCETDNEELINGLEKLAIDSNRSLSFIGSEMNLQDGQMDIDYIYVQAQIKPTIGT